MPPAIYLLDASLDSPAANLAADEALLLWCAAHPATEALRFWEPTSPFVVLGHSNCAATEANLDACTRLGIPVLRRCSGGGAVLQIPGCLNYTLVLNLAGRPELGSIPAANRVIMETHQRALQPLVPQPIHVRGITDLALHTRKFSGNAQKRTRTHLLFHGTFLLQANLDLIPQLLHPPSRQPAYRQNRAHTEFLVNVELSPQAVRTALRHAWHASLPFEAAALDPYLPALLQQRYGCEAWHRKF